VPENLMPLSDSVSQIPSALSVSPRFADSLSKNQKPNSDTFMQKTARLYQDTRTASATAGSNLERLNDDLQDVTRIMTKNMEELLWRGDSLDSEFLTSIL
jgi:hypothetical protein